jgi:hypothetical protein
VQCICYESLPVTHGGLDTSEHTLQSCKRKDENWNVLKSTEPAESVFQKPDQRCCADRVVPGYSGLSKESPMARTYASNGLTAITRWWTLVSILSKQACP